MSTVGVILFGSDKAARFDPVSETWISRRGMNFGNCPGAERRARAHGSTHFTCGSCGRVRENRASVCEACSERHRQQWYDGLKAGEWDGGWLYAGASVEYYCDTEDLCDQFWDLFEVEPGADRGQILGVLEEMRLQPCEPDTPRVDPEELYEGWFEEWFQRDGGHDPDEFPDGVIPAIAALNKALEAQVRWHPDGTRLSQADLELLADEIERSS